MGKCNLLQVSGMPLMEALVEPPPVGAVITTGSSHAIARDFAIMLDHLILPRRHARPLADMWLRNGTAHLHNIAASYRAVPLVLPLPVNPVQVLGQVTTGNN